MTKKKRTTEKPITADELLAMDADELHEWVSRRMAERIAYGERRAAKERAARKPKSSSTIESRSDT